MNPILSTRSIHRWLTASLVPLATATVLAGVPAPASADGSPGTLTVATDGHDAGDCRTTACASISYAVSVSTPGDTIAVGPGTFRDRVLVPMVAGTDAQPLTIRGAGAGATIVSGEQKGRVFTINHWATVRLTGLSIVLGRAGDGGGVLNMGDTQIDDSTISYNEADAGQGSGRGGGVYSPYGGSLTMTNSTVSRNTAVTGGGLSFYEGSLTDNLIVQNTAREQGGGIEAFYPKLVRNTVLANQLRDGQGHATGVGGGVFALIPLQVAFNTVTGNSAASAGGFVTAQRAVEDQGNLVAANSGGNCNGPFSMSSVGSVEDSQGEQNHCGLATRVADAGVASSAEDHGGPRPSVALAADSPAVGVVPASVCTEYGDVDTRGVSRNAVARGGCDAGAYDTVTMPAVVVDPGGPSAPPTPPAPPAPPTVKRADLAVTVRHDGRFVRGHLTRLVARVGNRGTASTSVVLTATLPSGMVRRAVSAPGWSCSARGQVLRCTRSAALAPRAVSHVTLTARVTALVGRTLATVVRVTPRDATPGTNVAIDRGIVRRR